MPCGRSEAVSVSANVRTRPAIYQVFEGPKYLADISKYPRFSRVGVLHGTLLSDPNAKFSLLALLQSRTEWFVFTRLPL